MLDILNGWINSSLMSNEEKSINPKNKLKILDIGCVLENWLFL